MVFSRGCQYAHNYAPFYVDQPGAARDDSRRDAPLSMQDYTDIISVIKQALQRRQTCQQQVDVEKE